ncbi:RNase A-like domain-containing protein [Paraburkholderia sp. Cy-641]|uniref:RNase A-like domain-containing protein n=1 Tax=Burkholderiaceae TaxID=119060 RepID=UPI0031F53D98
MSEVVRVHTTQVQNWAKSSGSGGPLTLMQHVAGDVGYGIERQTGKLTRMNEVVVVLKYQTCNGMPYYILTAYVG